MNLSSATKRSRQTRKAALAGGVLLAALTACGSTVQLSGGSTNVPGAVNQLGQTGATTGTDTPGTTTDDPSLAPGEVAPSDVPGEVTQTDEPGATPTTVGATQTGGTTAGPTTAAAIPATGRGWDKNVVHIGLTTAKDISTVGATLGIKSIYAGDLGPDATAMANYLNSKGGVLGRKVVVDAFDVKTTDAPEGVGQAICTHFTQDTKVIAVVNMSTNGDTASFETCMAKAEVPVMAWVTDSGDDSLYTSLSGYYNNMPFPSWTRFAKPFVQRLVAQHYFDKWNTTKGGPGSQTVKTGLAEPDTVQGHQIAKQLIAALASAGHAPATNDVYFYAGSQDARTIALRFEADGVTHVMGGEGLSALMTSFENQKFRPRFGINSSNAPALFMQGIAPAAQLVGSVGVGVIPTIDVHDNRDPGAAAIPGRALCDSIYSKAGISYSPDKRYAHTNEYGICDAFRTIALAAVKAGGFTGPQIRTGIGLAGPLVPTALTFRNGLTTKDHGLPGGGRDLQYDTSCSCYKYVGVTYPI